MNELSAAAAAIRRAMGQEGRGREGKRLGGRITVLTGADISAESGIATFRGGGGLWENHSLEEVATLTSTTSTSAPARVASCTCTVSS